MNRTLLGLSLLVSLMTPFQATPANPTCPPLLDFSAKTLDGRETLDFCKRYEKQVVLVVNTASQCGYTGQLSGLQKLYETYRDRGFVILGFPSNDFRQEYDNAADTMWVVRKDYGVTFPMLEKSGVSGNEASPFFKALAQASGQAPSWNFQKYLIGRNGKFLRVYPSNVGPDDPLFRLEVESAIAEKP